MLLITAYRIIKPRLFFSRCQLEAKKSRSFLCSGPSLARKTLEKIAKVKELLIVKLSQAFLDQEYKYSVLIIFSIIGNFNAS